MSDPTVTVIIPGAEGEAALSWTVDREYADELITILTEGFGQPVETVAPPAAAAAMLAAGRAAGLVHVEPEQDPADDQT